MGVVRFLSAAAVKIDLPDPADSAKVISIDVARARHFAFPEKERCGHRSVLVDQLESELTCKDCGVKVNAVEWLQMFHAYTGHLSNLIAKLTEARTAYEAKKRCRCEHCHKITAVRPASAAEVREFRRGATQDEGKTL